MPLFSSGRTVKLQGNPMQSTFLRVQYSINGKRQSTRHRVSLDESKMSGDDLAAAIQTSIASSASHINKRVHPADVKLLSVSEDIASAAPTDRVTYRGVAYRFDGGKPQRRNVQALSGHIDSVGPMDAIIAVLAATHRTENIEIISAPGVDETAGPSFGDRLAEGLSDAADDITSKSDTESDTDGESATGDPTTDLTAEAVAAMNKGKLIEACLAHGLDQSGTVPTLKARLLDHIED